MAQPASESTPRGTTAISVLERSNPPPRRKSCDACIKAKRRCTLESPSCLRCSQRKLACKYPSGSSLQKRRPPQATAPPIGASATLSTPVQPPPADQENTFPSWPSPFVPGQQSSLAAPAAYSLLPAPGLHSLIPDVGTPSLPIDESISMMDLMLDFSADEIVPFPLEFQNPDRSHCGGKSSDGSIVPYDDRVYEEAISIAISTRLQYAIDSMRAAPKQMVLENQTPWCHPSLYKHNMPPVMEDAYATCALYMAKNPVNSDLIFRSIENRVRAVVHNPMPDDKTEVLARAQALLLYHIMCLLGGGVRARTAESTITSLEESAFALMKFITFEEGTFQEPSCGDNTTEPIPRTDNLPALYPLNGMHSFWEAWAFQESARRTFLATFFFLQTYRLLKRENPLLCDGKILLCHSFTLSAHLWKARDHFEFRAAWEEKNHFIVKNANFREVMSDARADDIDIFGKMLITTLYGISEAKTWLLTRGGDL